MKSYIVIFNGRDFKVKGFEFEEEIGLKNEMKKYFFARDFLTIWEAKEFIFFCKKKMELRGTSASYRESMSCIEVI